jgi:hypothetical protein
VFQAEQRRAHATEFNGDLFGALIGASWGTPEPSNRQHRRSMNTSLPESSSHCKAVLGADVGAIGAAVARDEP